MNILQKISRRIIKASFDTSVSTIEYFSKMDKYHLQVDELRKRDISKGNSQMLRQPQTDSCTQIRKSRSQACLA